MYRQNNVTSQQLDFRVTALRLEPAYILYYVHWTRLLATGLLPLLFLVAANTAIYAALRRRHHAANLEQKQQQVCTLITLLLYHLPMLHIDTNILRF